MATAVRRDPFRSFHFAVELRGLTLACGFTECSGFGATTEPEVVNEGGMNWTSRQFVGRTKQNNIVLKWGTTSSRELYDWHFDTLNGKVRRLDGSVVLYDEKGTEAARWNFVRGWPTKWDGPPLNASGNEVAVETLEIAHEGLERERPQFIGVLETNPLRI